MEIEKKNSFVELKVKIKFVGKRAKETKKKIKKKIELTVVDSSLN